MSDEYDGHTIDLGPTPIRFLTDWADEIADSDGTGQHAGMLRWAITRIAELEEQIDVLEGMNASRADRITELETEVRWLRAKVRVLGGTDE